MREILFRGKCRNEWFEGLLSRIQEQWYIKPYYSDTKKVAPETVGQYTGLTDKNGKKIFEGDILKCHYDELYPDDYCYEEVVWKYNGWCRREENGYDAFDEDGVVKYGEVIGNIHDNPELLGGISNEKDN